MPLDVGCEHEGQSHCMPYLAFYNVERNRQGTVQETTRSDVHTRAQRENHRTVPRSDRTTLKHEGGRAGCA